MNNSSNEFLFLDDLKKCFNRGETVLRKALKKFNCEIVPTKNVPIKDAPFPHISNNPKYSPDFSGGIILA